MNILYIITQADGGGAQRYVLSQAKHFGGSIAAGTEDAALFEIAKKENIKTYPLKHLKRNINFWHDLLALFEIYNLVKKVNPDIVHLNSTKAGFIGSIAAKLAGTKVIFTAHGFRFLEPLSPLSRSFYLWIEKFASTYRDHIITVSEKDEKSARDNKIIPANKISTIHNGIPQLQFLTAEEAKAKLNLPPDKFVFGTIANFYKTKGLDILLEAINLLDKSAKRQAKFAIIGNGNESIKSNLEYLIQKYNLSSQVVLLGKVPEAYKFLKAFDAYILPSRKEGFPFALLDALQAGLPIIATEVGGNREALGDAGVMVNPENPNELCQAINTVLRDSQTIQALSKKSMERSKLFTEEKMFAKTQSVYEKVLGK